MVEERWLHIAAVLDRVPEACDFVVAAAEAADLDERAVYQCQMAVDEAVTNVVEHGYGGDNAEACIDIGCMWGEGEFIVKILDDSPAFNPLERTDPDPALSLEERTNVGGWGIFFIKKMMDHVKYEYSGNRNRFIMRKTMPLREAGEAFDDGTWRREALPGVWLIRPSGRLDSISSQSFEQNLKSELDIGHVCLIVDMSQVTYVSSSGLKALVSAWRHARDMGGMVAIAAMQTRVQEVFDMVGFDRVFTTFPAVEEAVEAAGAGQLNPECGR